MRIAFARFWVWSNWNLNHGISSFCKPSSDCPTALIICQTFFLIFRK
jgi:hypothetical protein